MEVQQTMGAIGSRVILGGDFNAKSPLWGSPREDAKGKILAEWIASRRLIVANEGDAPTFQRGESASILDLTLATENMVRAVTGWLVRAEETLSLHNYVEFNLALRQGVRKEDQNFREVLQKGKIIELLRRELEGHGTETDLSFFVSRIKELQDRATCRVREREGGRNMYWWSEEIQDQRNKSLRARRAYTRFRRHGQRWE